MNCFQKELFHIERVINAILFDFYIITATLVGISLLIVAPRLMAYEVEANLIQTIETSNFPAPDTAGIVYLPSQDAFLVSDSEINEMTIFQGANVFKIDRNGRLLETLSTMSFSDEPTGVAINPENKHCFFSDDTGTVSIYEVDPGIDGLCLTADDTVTSFATDNNFGISDPEDVTYGLNSLFIADADNNKVYRIQSGSDGLFDNVTRDDLVNSFDTASLDVDYPTGIVFDPKDNTLYIVGSHNGLIIHTSITGELLRTIDLSTLNPNRPAGLALAPSSKDPTITNLYMVVRGEDNDDDPNENDGAIYEMQIPALITRGNEMPVVSTGEDQTITLPANARLNGSVSDDGIPDSVLTSTWSKHSGPGEVSFTDPHNSNTTVSFSMAGTYVLRLIGDDGELHSFDDLSIVVNAGISELFFLQNRVSASTDDAEERANASMYLNSSDLELVFNNGLQTVGVRFTNLSIPENAIITNAYIQFKVDERSTESAQFTIYGENTDNALSFDNIKYNISDRTKTNASVSWSPVAWSEVGSAGEDQRTSDLSPIVQEIVSETGWNSGNAMVFIFTGAGERVAETYDGDPAGAPLLYVEYTNNVDSVLPTIELKSPVDGAVVTGIINLQVETIDDSGVASIQYQWDSRNIGSPVTEAPFSLMWNTTEIGDGFYTLTAIATDLDDNTTVSNYAVVQIANDASPTDPTTFPPLPHVGDTLNVPDQYATIQAAVDAAKAGDLILIAPGTYTGGIKVSAQGITIASRFIFSADASDVKSTIIKGGTPVILVNGSAGNTRIIGLTIMNGIKGVQCYVFCEVLNNFFDNVASDAMSLENTGGNIIANEFIGSGDDAIDLDGLGETWISENKIKRCKDDGIEIRNFDYSGSTINVVIRNNSIDDVGEDGLQLIDYPANSNRIFTFENNLITNSNDAGIGLMADGVTVENLSAASVPERIYVFNNTIVGNKVGLSGGDNLVAVNNIFVNSSIYAVKGVNGNSIAAYNLYYNTTGNIFDSNITQETMLNADPKFDTAYKLQADSPAIDSGTKEFVFEGETVLQRSGFLGKNPDLGSIESK